MKSRGRVTCVVFHRVRRHFKLKLRSCVSFLLRSRAFVWRKIDWAHYRVRIWIARHGTIAALILLLVMFGISAVWIPTLHGWLDSLMATEERLQGLRSLFQTLGGALLGATAIVSSLVLFSMQVNVERMPHGLFRRFSSDRRLLGAFAVAFFLAIFIAVLSLISDKWWLGYATFSAAWATFFILLLFLYAYRRALTLVNPVRQLEMVVDESRQEFRTWARRAQRTAQLLMQPKPSTDDIDDPFVPKHDFARLAFFKANPHWTENAKQAVRYTVSFARHYAEQGDHDVSAEAMNTIIGINASYIEAKGRTFFTDWPLFEEPVSMDSFINDTLEHMRQTARIAIARGDEQQIKQTLQVLAALVRVYAGIDYGTPRASKTHAHLAVYHLTSEIERIVPQNMPDVLMVGARLMGQCADFLLAAEGPEAVQTLVQKLGAIGRSGVMKEDYRPVTLTCVEQLARLSFDLLPVRSGDVKFASEEIRSSLSLLARLFLALPETPFSNTHSFFLGPYYSATSTQALSTRLAGLVDAVVDAKADDKNAQQVIYNIENWADGLYRTEKELLLEAIKRRSQFTFDMVHWVSKVTTILLAVSNAPACDDRTRTELRKHALWLISVLSFVPEDIETVKFIETFRMTETLFEAALDAHNRSCPDIAADITRLLVSWMFKGGQYHSGWAILERSIYGLAVLALAAAAASGIATLKTEIGKRLAAGGLPDQEVRDHAALEIRGRAATLHRDGHWSSSIERAIAQADHTKLKPLLEELANLISPETVGQASSRGLF
jgi:hypothetical protein